MGVFLGGYETTIYEVFLGFPVVNFWVVCWVLFVFGHVCVYIVVGVACEQDFVCKNLVRQGLYVYSGCK